PAVVQEELKQRQVVLPHLPPQEEVAAQPAVEVLDQTAGPHHPIGELPHVGRDCTCKTSRAVATLICHSWAKAASSRSSSTAKAKRLSRWFSSKVLTGPIRCGQADSRARNSATTKSNRSRRMAYSGPATETMSSRSQRANNATSSANAIALASADRAYDSFWARLWSFWARLWSFRPRRSAVACF